MVVVVVVVNLELKPTVDRLTSELERQHLLSFLFGSARELAGQTNRLAAIRTECKWLASFCSNEQLGLVAKVTLVGRAVSRRRKIKWAKQVRARTTYVSYE